MQQFVLKETSGLLSSIQRSKTSTASDKVSGWRYHNPPFEKDFMIRNTKAIPEDTNPSSTVSERRAKMTKKYTD